MPLMTIFQLLFIKILCLLLKLVISSINHHMIFIKPRNIKSDYTHKKQSNIPDKRVWSISNVLDNHKNQHNAGHHGDIAPLYSGV